MGVLEYVRHAPDAVVHLHQPVGIEDFLAGGFFRRRETIANDLEDIGVGGQGEHRHHHALDAGREHQFVFRVFQVVQKIAVKNRFSLLVEADGRVKRLLAAGRHQAAQEGYDGRRHRVVDHEINVGKLEQAVQALLADDDCITIDGVVAAMQYRNRERHRVIRVDRAADDIGRLVAVEHGADHLELKVQMRPPRTRKSVPDQGMGDIAHVALDVLEGQVETAVEQNLLDRGAEAALRRVVDVVRGFLRIDEFGRNRAAYEDIVIAEVVAMKQRAKHRVVKGFGQLRLQVIADQQHVFAFDVEPQLAIERFQVVLFLQLSNRILDANVVKLDAFARSHALGIPVGVFETLLGALGYLAENREMSIETIENGAGNFYR